MEEAARVALCSSQPNGVDSTQALLKTFAWVEPPEENTFCTVPSVPPHHNRERQLGSKVHENGQPAIEIIPGMWLNCCVFFFFFYNNVFIFPPCNPETKLHSVCNTFSIQFAAPLKGREIVSPLFRHSLSKWTCCWRRGWHLC